MVLKKLELKYQNNRFALSDIFKYCDYYIEIYNIVHHDANTFF